MTTPASESRVSMSDWAALTRPASLLSSDREGLAVVPEQDVGHAGDDSEAFENLCLDRLPEPAVGNMDRDQSRHATHPKMFE